MLERLFSRLELKIPPPVVIVFAGLLNRLGRDWGQVPFDPPWIPDYFTDCGVWRVGCWWFDRVLSRPNDRASMEPR